MYNLHQTAARLREQMCSFLGNLPTQVKNKTARRFCLEALYGIATRKSLHLTESGRALNEQIPLKKTENRLSRQAGREGLDEQIGEFVIEQSVHRIKENTLLIVDPSDIAKKYAEKMEYLARVRDGSEGTLANGYWLCQVIGVECGGQEITPLVNHLWSHDHPDHLSENSEVLTCINRVARHAGKRGIFVIDRAGDRMSIVDPLVRSDLRFLIRLVGNRHLLLKKQRILADELAELCPLPYKEIVTKEKRDGTEERFEISFGVRRVELPAFPGKKLWFVVAQGFGEKPLMLLTTEEIKGSRKSIWWAVESYLTRWRIEETLRFAKQSYRIEDVRVLTYQRLKNMMAFVLLVMSFTMTWLGQKEKLAVLAHHALVAGKNLFGIPDFRFYTLCNGIAGILGKHTKQVFKKEDTLPRSQQLELMFFSSG